MAQVLSGNLYEMKYAINRQVSTLLIEATSVDEADTAVLNHASSQPGYGGQEIRIVAVSVIYEQAHDPV
jgi:hypothetical protein